MSTPIGLNRSAQPAKWLTALGFTETEWQRMWPKPLTTLEPSKKSKAKKIFRRKKKDSMTFLLI